MTWTRTSSAGPTMTSWATVRSGRSIRLTIKTSLPRSKCRRPPNPETLKTYRVTWVIEVEADTPLNAARRARFYQTRPGTLAYEVSEVCLRAAECYGPPVTIDLSPRRQPSP